MLEILYEPGEINKAQKLFKGILQENMEKWPEEITLGYPSGNYDISAHYDSKNDFWYTYQPGNRDFPEGVIPRHINSFGLGKPKQGNNNITCEINQPLDIKRRVSGIYLKQNNKIYVGHRGSIRSTHGTKKADVLQHFHDTRLAKDKDRETKVLIVSEINKESLAQNIKEFLVFVNDIKKGLYS